VEGGPHATAHVFGQTLGSREWNQRASAQLLQRDLALCEFLFDQAEFVVLEQDLVVDLGLDGLLRAGQVRLDVRHRQAGRRGIRLGGWLLRLGYLTLGLLLGRLGLGSRLLDSGAGNLGDVSMGFDGLRRGLDAIDDVHVTGVRTGDGGRLDFALGVLPLLDGVGMLG